MISAIGILTKLLMPITFSPPTGKSQAFLGKFQKKISRVSNESYLSVASGSGWCSLVGRQLSRYFLGKPKASASQSVNTVQGLVMTMRGLTMELMQTTKKCL